MSVVINVEHLGKLYRLGKIGTGTLSHDLKRWWAEARGLEDPFAKVGRVNDRTRGALGDEYVWALKDISFDISQGDVVGIIGKNGAGKSTLLKILSRITAPTTGAVRMKGRVGSLLEVGTGFHPEMTGRENVFMNGTVLGMRRHEILRKFDEIIEFAGVAKYVDTPVKRYSSGMLVRLGFAVAAFLEPEILIVDEVLAVGDAEFQKKALGKMKQVSESSGRTILFVSHNLRAVTQLCKKGFVIQNGSLSYVGDIDGAVKCYVEGENILDNKGIYFFEPMEGRRLKLIKASILNGEGNVQTTFTSRDKAIFSVDFEINESLRGARIGMHLENQDHVVVFTTTNADSMARNMEPGKYSSQCEIPVSLLNEGEYTIRVFAGVPGHEVLLKPLNIIRFTQKLLESQGLLLTERRKGTIVPHIDWKMIQQ